MALTLSIRWQGQALDEDLDLNKECNEWSRLPSQNLLLQSKLQFVTRTQVASLFVAHNLV